MLLARIEEIRSRHGLSPSGERVGSVLGFRVVDGGLQARAIPVSADEVVPFDPAQRMLVGERDVPLLWRKWNRLGLRDFLLWCGVWQSHVRYVLRTMGSRRSYLGQVIIRIVRQLQKGRVIVRLGAYLLSAIYDRSRNPIPHPRVTVSRVKPLRDVLEVLLGMRIYAPDELVPLSPGGMRVSYQTAKRLVLSRFARPG